MITQHQYISSIIILCVSAFLSLGHAQQDSQYTQYMYNTQTINPAYAGNRGALSLNSIYRTQWVGLEGAPETVNIVFNTPVNTRGLGLGMSFFSDKIGPSQESNVTVDFSYTISVGDNARLSFGINGGLNILDVDFSRLNFDPGDPYANNINGRLSPNVGLGFYLHNSDKWYVGLSSPNILKTEHYDDVAVSTATEEAHIYMIGGYIFDLNPNLKFKPALLTKAVVGAPMTFDLSANFLFNKRLTMGASYRFDVAVSGLVGFQMTNNIMLGYAYDYDTTELGNYNSGSHEIFLRFELGKLVRTMVNPRFF